MWSEEAVLRTDPVRDEGRRRRSGGGRVAGCGAPWFVDNGRGHHQRVSAEPPRFLTQDDDRIVKADSLRAGLSKGRSPTRSVSRFRPSTASCTTTAIPTGAISRDGRTIRRFCGTSARSRSSCGAWCRRAEGQVGSTADHPILGPQDACRGGQRVSTESIYSAIVPRLARSQGEQAAHQSLGSKTAVARDGTANSSGRRRFPLSP